MAMPLLSELPQQEALISPTSDLDKSIQSNTESEGGA